MLTSCDKNTTEKNDEKFDLIGNWYSKDWNEYLTIEQKENFYTFQVFNDDSVNEAIKVTLVSQKSINGFVTYVFKDTNNSLKYTIKELSNSSIEYMVEVSDSKSVGMTNSVTFLKIKNREEK